MRGYRRRLQAFRSVNDIRSNYCDPAVQSLVKIAMSCAGPQQELQILDNAQTRSGAFMARDYRPIRINILIIKRPK